jgi:CRP-like cAMP-binding protein
MNVPLRALRFDVQGLIQAIAHNASSDAFSPNFASPQWEMFATYLQPFELKQGQVLIEKKSSDRTVYFVESGNLTVHYEDSKGRVRLAIVGPGSAVGEGAFLSRNPRTATVQAAAPSKVWCLTSLRFTELCNRNPPVALELAMALGSLVARRLANKPRRVAVT